jgi:deoxyribonuclease V
MIAAFDVQYEGTCGRVACVTFTDWTAEVPAREYVSRVNEVQDYEPGEFWKRELPCILAALNAVDPPPHTVVIDGYVWLDADARPGMGAHLFEALRRRVAVVGVAKTAFRGSEHAARVSRPGTRRPLFVTAAGVPLEEAAARVGRMSGQHRIPSLLRRVDQLARGGTPVS